MELSEKNSEIIKTWLDKHDAKEIAGMLGYSDGFVRLVLTGKRNYDTPAGREVMRLALRKARQNKYFREKQTVQP